MLLAFLALTLAASEPTPPAASPPPVEVLFHADLEGRLAQPTCGGAGPALPDFAALAGTIQRLRREAEAAQRPAPVVLLGGNSLGPDLFAQDWRARDPASARAAMTALFARAGYDAMVLGNHELELGAEELAADVIAFQANHLPVVATNLQCTGASAPICLHTVPELLLERGAEKLGILAAITPGVLKTISAEARKGLRLQEVAPALRIGMERLRAEGATRILVLLQATGSDTALAEVRAIQLQLRGHDAPDLLLSTGLADADGTGAVRLLRTDDHPSVVGSARGGGSLTRATVGPDGVDAEAVTIDPTDADPTARTLLAPEVSNYCARYGVPIGAGKLAHPLTRDQMVTYALEVLRRRMGTEVALINRHLFKAEEFPLTAPLTRADLYRAMPYAPRMGVATVTGAQLHDLVGPALGNPLLAVVGMDPSTLQVNGRALDATRSYRIATIDFVAEGGDGLFAKGALPFSPAEGSDLRVAVEEYMATEAGSEDGNPSIDPATDFGPDGSQRLLLVGIGDLELDFTDTSITNPAGFYTDAQLTRDQSRSFKGEATGQLQVRHPLHTEDTVLNLKYGYAKTEAPGTPPTSGETEDLITLSNIYGYRGLRPRLGVGDAAWMPDPYARLYFESEFVQPAVTPTQTRTWHHAELSGTLGALWSPTSTLKLRAGAGARKELLARMDSPNPEEVEVARYRFLAEAGAALTPTAIATVGKWVIKVEGTLDYAYVDPAWMRENEVIGSGKLSMPLLPMLFFTAGLDVFAVKRDGAAWGTSYDTTVGLKLHWDGARQSL